MDRAHAQRRSGGATFAMRGCLLAVALVLLVTSTAIAQQVNLPDDHLPTLPGTDAGAAQPGGPMVTTVPATQPTVDPAKIEKWLTALNDRVPAAREDAIGRLYELSRADLPAVKETARKLSPLSPTQIEVLRDVVMQVYLSGEPYAPSQGADTAFMGAALGTLTNADGTSGGIVIQSRVPGFGAYASLHDGDVILSIDERPRVQMETPNEFIVEVKQFSPGDTLHLRILRQGKILSAAVKLAARPLVMPFSENSQFNLDRAASAEAYWQKNFASLAPDETADVN